MSIVLWSIATILFVVGGVWCLCNEINGLFLKADEEELYTAYEYARGALVATLNKQLVTLKLQKQLNEKNLRIAIALCALGFVLLLLKVRGIL